MRSTTRRPVAWMPSSLVMRIRIGDSPAGLRYHMAPEDLGVLNDGHPRVSAGPWRRRLDQWQRIHLRAWMLRLGGDSSVEVISAATSLAGGGGVAIAAGGGEVEPLLWAADHVDGALRPIE